VSWIDWSNDWLSFYFTRYDCKIEILVDEDSKGVHFESFGVLFPQAFSLKLETVFKLGIHIITDMFPGVPLAFRVQDLGMQVFEVVINLS
jgi:hypothetical protein